VRPLAAGALLIALGCSREPHARTEPAPGSTTPTTATTAPVAKVDVAPPRPEKLSHVTLKALGMYCEESCPLKVRYALADMKSVYELGFDVSNEAIFVSYDAALGAAKDVTRPMLAAIKTAGFDPWLAKEEWPADATAQVVLR
jgi:hypothetical protein